MAELNNMKIDGLLNAVSKKIGVPADTLKSELQNGKFDSAIKNMPQKDAAMFNQILNNPQMLEKMMSTPQAKALYNKLKG